FAPPSSTRTGSRNGNRRISRRSRLPTSTPISRHSGRGNWACERRRLRPGRLRAVGGGNRLRLVPAPRRRLLPLLRGALLDTPDRRLSGNAVALRPDAASLAGGGQRSRRLLSLCR